MTAFEGLVEVAKRQFGLVSRTQALEGGLTRDEILGRLARGEFETLRRGVYRFRGTHSSWSQHAMGVLLHAGAGAALSHGTAAFLHKLDGFTGKRGPQILDVTAGLRELAAPNVRFHRTREVLPTETIGSLLTTSLARTVVDLAPLLDARKMEIALDSARRSRSLLPNELREHFKTMRFWLPQVSALEEMLASRESPLDSSKEVDLLHEIMERGLPKPVAGYSVFLNKRFVTKVDAAWPDKLVALHFDSYHYHHHRERFERDARQRSLLAGAHWHNIVVTSRSLKSREWSDSIANLLR